MPCCLVCFLSEVFDEYFKRKIGTTQKEIVKKISTQKVVLPKIKKVSGECWKLIEALLEKDPTKRITTDDIFHSPWLQLKYFSSFLIYLGMNKFWKYL